MVEQDAGRCSGLALEKHAAHAAKGRNPPSPLPGPISVTISIREFSPNTDTEARISAGGQRGDREQHRPNRTSPNINPQPQAPDTCTYTDRENPQRAWNMKREREREREKDWKSEK